MDQVPMRLADIAKVVAQYGTRRYLEKHAAIGAALPTGIGLGLAAPAVISDSKRGYRATRNRLDDAALETLVPAVASGMKTAGVSDFFKSLAGQQPYKVEGRKPYQDPNTGNWGFMPNDPSVPARASAMLDVPASVLAGSIGGPLLQGGLMPLISAPGKGIGARVERRLSGREFGEKQDPLRMMGQATINSLGKGMGQIGADLLKDMATKAIAATKNIRNDSARTAIIEQLKKEDPILHDADDNELMEAYHTMTRFAPTLSTDKNAVRSFLRQAVMSGTGPDYMTIKLLAESENAIKGYKPGSKRDPWI